MLPLSPIIALVLYLLAMYFLYTFLRKVFKVLLVINVIMFLFMAIIFYLIIADINKMKTNIATSRLYVFSQNDKALSAFIVKGNQTLVIDNDQLQVISSELSSNDLISLSNNNLLYIYKSGIIKDDFRLYFGNRSLNSRELLEILNSSSDKNLKAFIFANIVNEYTQKGTDIIKGLKAGNVVIYPETVTFRVLKFIPDSIIDYTIDYTQQTNK